MADVSKVMAWLATREAQLFRECVTAKMNQLYCDAINAQARPSDTVDDTNKFNNMAQESLVRASKVRNFLAVFDEFTTPGYGLHKLKINV